MLNLTLPLPKLILFFKQRTRTSFLHPPFPPTCSTVRRRSPSEMRCFVSSTGYSWHQVSKNPRIKAPIIHNACLSRHHSAQSFCAAIRLKLYITCGESGGRKSIVRLREGTLKQQPLSVWEQSQRASLGRLKHSGRLLPVSGIPVFEEAIPKSSDRKIIWLKTKTIQ